MVDFEFNVSYFTGSSQQVAVRPFAVVLSRPVKPAVNPLGVKLPLANQSVLVGSVGPESGVPSSPPPHALQDAGALTSISHGVEWLKYFQPVQRDDPMNP